MSWISGIWRNPGISWQTSSVILFTLTQVLCHFMTELPIKFCQIPKWYKLSVAHLAYRAHIHLPSKNKYLTKFFTYGCAIHGDKVTFTVYVSYIWATIWGTPLNMSNSLKYRSPRKSKHLLYSFIIMARFTILRLKLCLLENGPLFNLASHKEFQNLTRIIKWSGIAKKVPLHFIITGRWS